MKKINQLKRFFCLLVLLAPLGLLSSCETVVDVDLPPHESKLVVNCLLNPDSLVTVRVYKSLGPLDRKDLSVVQNARVVLLENGVAVDTLAYVVSGSENLYRSHHFRPQPLRTYTLRVQAPGFPNAEASCTIPGKVPIKTATVRDSAGIDENGTYYSRLLVRFQDPGNEQNYYSLSGKQVQTYYPNPWDPNAPASFYYYPIYFFSDLPDVSDAGDNGMLLKDALFNGREYELALNFYPPYNDGSGGRRADTIMISFRSTSPEYYEYYRRLHLHLNNQGGNLFGGEPVVMPNNIQNGYGLFAGYSQDTLVVVR